MYSKLFLSAILLAAPLISEGKSAADSEDDSKIIISTDKSSWTIRGKVIDAQTDEEIIGAAVMVKDDPGKWAVSGLDGSFSVSVDAGESSTLVCSIIGYRQAEFICSETENNLTIRMEADRIMLDGATVMAENHGKTEAGARGIEKASLNVVNVMSAKAMELSPDVTVANVIKRMSGVTVERNSSGEGRYAILRGMDKRYNYTLVNGVKIPSPDNKNRFVPLDIFPSEMLDRLEVTKSLTADMEGDGIGGAVNLVMKDAPEDMELDINFSTGYSALFFNRDFQSFNHGKSRKQSPFERMGKPLDNYAVTADDFSMDNLRVKSAAPRPDIVGGFSYGDRFFNGRLGLMAAVSFQNLMRGKDSDIYYFSGSSSKGTEFREYSEDQMRLGTHLKLDYRAGERHKFMFYSGYMDMRESEVRDARNSQDWMMRMKYNRQYIFNSTLKGEHAFLEDKALKLDWTGVFSYAYNMTPDEARINMNGYNLAKDDAANRRWAHNSDRDLAGYVNLSYLLDFHNSSTLLLKAGGMYRDKARDSFFNEWYFDSATEDSQVYRQDWNNFDELLLEPAHKGFGNISDPLNYDATEKIAAGYFMMKYTREKFEVTAGVRAENTRQGYLLDYPLENADPAGEQNYTDILPSIHLKYNVHKNANLRLSYGRSINRPGFFEIVPYTILNEDYDEKGNPDLRHTVADNIDLRYEFFPKSSEQFMVGLFWKNLKDPIEYGLLTLGADTYLQPTNFGDAMNYGVEVDVMKYFNWFGIKANYTYTHSAITTDKTIRGEDHQVYNIQQTRPLYGQAAHVANLSLLLNFQKIGLEGQVSGSYTGKRLSEVSRWYNDDIWEAGFFTLDASIEKSFRIGISIYAKATNLLNSPLLRFITPGPMTEGMNRERYQGGVVERREWNGQSVMIGLRYRFNMKNNL